MYDESSGKTCDAVEERMQSANKAFWKDIKIFKSKDVLWRIICQRLVEHVHAVFSFGSETWSWTQQTLEKMKKVGNKNNDEMTRGDVGGIPDKNQHIMARKMWVQMKLPFGKYVARHGVGMK